MNTLDRYSSTIALLIVVGTFAAAALVAAAGRVPEAVLQPTPALQPILIIATVQPTPTPDMQVQQELAELRARVAELEAERSAPEPQVLAASVSQAAPTVAPPTPGPQLQTFVVQSDEEPLSPALLREAMDQ